MSKGDMNLGGGQIGRRTVEPGPWTHAAQGPTGGSPRRALIGELAAGQTRAALTFAGQGAPCLDELEALWRQSREVRAYVEAADDALAALMEHQAFRWSGLYSQGFALKRWVQDAHHRPTLDYLTSSTVSQPLIFITQIARYTALWYEGLSGAFTAGAVPVVTGHSQGIMPAVLVAESGGGSVAVPRFVEYVRYMAWQGLHMAQSWSGAVRAPSGATPMAAVTGLDAARLDALAREAVEHTGDTLTVALTNARTRHVVSGPVAALERLERLLDARAEAEDKARRAGRLAGRPLSFTFEHLLVGGPYHSPYMTRGLDAMRATVAELGFAVRGDALGLEVVSYVDNGLLNVRSDVTGALMVEQFVRPVRWPATVAALAARPGVEHVLDCGPGEGVARLTAGALRGTGVRVHALTTAEGRQSLFTEGASARPVLRYADLRPRLVTLPDGALAVDNAWTRATGRPPIILAGMTPTTVDVGIVAAAANAGFVAELAGGGQVTEHIFNNRMEELREALEPGREVVFNALFLDPYLWDLHLRRGQLVQKARRAGLPLCGVTISAGVPEVADAVALLDELVAAGLWLNAFKPGTAAHVAQVIKIAESAPHHVIFVHLEGGLAGGHHSWEDLDELLLETYHGLRACPNLVLCVGGGVGDEARAVELLTGAWAARYDAAPMPVDAVFLGTVAMACREATTSPQVKRALAEAAGHAGAVLSGEVRGGVTSGRSSLNADIHYLDNAASRCGRLLDRVAGDAAAVEAQRDAIIAALNQTAKPWLGDLNAMSWRQVLERMVALMAIGRHGRYEDGVWLDRSWRRRMADAIWRAEARLRGEGSYTSILGELGELDDPQAVLARLYAACGAGVDEPGLHPADVRYLVGQVFASAGKPVPFVPVIDADVRRWYKADSLWQAHDDRYEADQVLIIPGPAALRGVCAVDEPVGALLGRFERALVAQLGAEGAQPVAVERLRRPRVETVPRGLIVEWTEEATVLRASHEAAPDAWARWIAGHSSGPVAALFAATSWVEGRCVRPNIILDIFRVYEGGEVRIEESRGRAVAVTRALNEGREVARVVQGAEPDVLRVEVCAPGVGAGAGAVWSLELRWRRTGGADHFEVDAEARSAATRRFYQEAIFGRPIGAADLFTAARCRATFEPARARAWAAITGRVNPAPDALPSDAAFSLVWEPLMATLSCDALAGGLLDLVHLNNSIDLDPTRPPLPGEVLDAEARVVRVEDSAAGRRVRVEALVLREGERCARVLSGFFIRGAFGDTPWAVQAREPWRAAFALDELSAAALLLQPWYSSQLPLSAGDHIEIDATLGEDRPRHGAPRWSAQGVVRRGAEVVGLVRMEPADAADVSPLHPVRAFVAAVASPPLAVEGPRRVLAQAQTRTPASMEAFAEVGGDLNPLHRSVLVARLAGLERPIVHGMWTAARLRAFLVDALADGEARRFDGAPWSVEFLAPAELDEPLELEAARVGVEDGALWIEASASALRDGRAIPVVRGRARLAPPRTAFVFPGQGIQQRGMGMEAYGRSPAARAVWERADAFTRERLGFSILRVVRDNPRELLVQGRAQVHPQGVLHLTQFTQVAMAVLAQAQIAELREARVLPLDAITCGHSVGEYNALGALIAALPLETVVEVVYQRGMVMHRFVPRDAQGASGYGMSVIRPNCARLDHAGAEALVNEVRARTGRFLQIVNYNIRGRQYAVTGHTDALRALADALAARTPAGGKPALVEVPGVDVPFHSEVLRSGVADFRATLDHHLPAQIDPTRLVDRYVPNLTATVFRLERAFICEIHEACGADVLGDVLADFDAWMATPARLARRLLVELLAWQFASPVRWIETQERLLRPRAAGGLGVERLIEVGVGYQPTLTNMARASLPTIPTGDRSIELLNVEANADQVRCVDQAAAAPEAEPTSATPEPAAAPSAATPAVSVSPAPAAPTAPVEDRPMTPAEGLRSLLAIQARVRPEQISPAETIDALFDGVSSRRNQVLLDLGAEFDLGTIDGAHERPIGALAEEIARRARAWRGPGRYLRPTCDDALKRVFGRAGLGRRELVAWLQEGWGLGEGLCDATLDALMLETREGDSARGGALGQLAGAQPRDRKEALATLDRAVALMAAARGLALAPRAAAASNGAAVDAAVVRELEERLAGPDGALMHVARDLASRLGHPLEPTAAGDDGATHAALERLRVLDAEHGPGWDALIAPRFDRRRHVAFTSGWAWAQRDLARLAWDVLNGRIDAAALAREAERLAPWGAASPRVADTARWFADEARRAGALALADALARVAAGQGGGRPFGQPTRPQLEIGEQGELRYQEVPVGGEGAWAGFVAEVVGQIGAPPHAAAVLGGALERLVSHPMGVQGRTAVVTGASPGSIAVEVVRHLLRGGAQVVVTTSTATPERMAWYRALYQEAAAPGAALHVVPLNQASLRDVEAFIDWLFAEVTEQAGAGVRVVKRPMSPDLLIPFGAIKDLGTADQLGPRSDAALRAMVLGVERLITGIAARHLRDGLPARPCHVLLPLSPNHGTFGGDGLYAESKLALEALLPKWRSEAGAWGRATTICGACIGWVRGTGLMDANDPVAVGLEAQCGVRTFSTAEMGLLLAALCDDAVRQAAASAPLRVDLTGGLGAHPDLRGAVEQVRAELDQRVARARRRAALAVRLNRAAEPPATLRRGLADWPRPLVEPRRLMDSWSNVHVSLERAVVIVGAGELGPWGSSRTRFEVEVDRALSDAGVLELAWMCGLVRFEDDGRGGAWIDVATGETVEEAELGARYREQVAARAGIRVVDPEIVHYDPSALSVLATVYLERDLTFRVGSAEEARAFVLADAEHTRARYDARADAWEVTRKAGAAVRVPRAWRLSRQVAGQLPEGFDFGRYGITPDMIERVDRVTLFNLVATVEAFMAAGITPEELLSRVHPARVGNTQGGGIGGMRSLQRLYLDHLLGEDRQSDVLQETLINVLAAYVVQSYVGSYGAMAQPVGACATAAVSLEEGLDKILAGKADFVVAGGFDDIGREGAIGFADMGATADSDELGAMGLNPDQMSRPNDVRRRGFVESHGGGTLLLCRGDLAARLGLPVLGVLAWAGSFADGVHKSIPAPGMGALAAAMGGPSSPLGAALAAWGLSADDVQVVYKHDTSTGANDPNESLLHHRIQTALGRTPGNPLWVVSQKSLTGHSKGGAAAWQAIGLCQTLAAGTIAGNRNLDSVDDALRPHTHLAFTDAPLRPGPALRLRAGLLTSLGFGHISGVALILHPDAFLAALPADARAGWVEQAHRRVHAGRRQQAAVQLGVAAAWEKRAHRRFAAPDGSEAQAEEEAAMLLDPAARLDPASGLYYTPSRARAGSAPGDAP